MIEDKEHTMLDGGFLKDIITDDGKFEPMSAMACVVEALKASDYRAYQSLGALLHASMLLWVDTHPEEIMPGERKTQEAISAYMTKALREAGG